ncbi:hypothetical protein [Spongiibacter tropicus]|uniref:hypothetical protein n=1 Tax=Spongiibacter tropicus TaxID=454602 RepID=UPI0035BE21B4
MSKYLVSFALMVISVVSHAALVDCVRCQGVFETDIEGAKEFGIIVKVESLGSPPVSRVEISEHSLFKCGVGKIDLSVGAANPEVGPDVVANYESISSFQGATIKSRLMAGARLDLVMDCSGTALANHWRKEARETVLSIFLNPHR